MVQLLTANSATNLYWLGRYIERISGLLTQIMPAYDDCIDINKNAGIELYKGYSIDIEYESAHEFLKVAMFGEHSSNLVALAGYARENAIICRSYINTQAFGEIIELHKMLENASNSYADLDYKLIDDALSLISEIWGEISKLSKSNISDHFLKLGRLIERLKNMQNLTLSTNLNLEYKEDALTLRSKLKAQADYSDFATSQKNERSYLRLDELYGQYDFLDDQIVVGKSIRFWGALELRNITDGFNPTELRDDPFAMDKLGVWNASYAHYFDTSELSIIAKLYEPQREMAGYPYVYYYFPSQINSLPNQYSNSLKSEKSQTRPSLYLKYSGTTEGDYSIDYAFIFQNGYDSQRYFSSSVLGDAITNIPYKTQLQENAYLVNKFSTYNTMVLGATLYKLEALYADVIDNEEISDYMHIGLGVEHTLYGVYENADLALLLEYYNYSTFEDGKRDDLALFELFQNDLFVGLRLSLNDAKESKITTGAIIDMEYDEQVYYIEYESRLNDIFVLDFDYRYIAPSPSDLTAFKLMGRHQRVGLKVGYAF